MNKIQELRGKIEEILVNRCEECIRARFGDARDASEFVASDRDKVLRVCKEAGLKFVPNLVVNFKGMSAEQRTLNALQDTINYKIEEIEI